MFKMGNATSDESKIISMLNTLFLLSIITKEQMQKAMYGTISLSGKIPRNMYSIITDARQIMARIMYLYVFFMIYSSFFEYKVFLNLYLYLYVVFIIA